MTEASRDANRVIGVDGWTQLHEETKNGNITYVTVSASALIPTSNSFKRRA